LFEFEGFAQQHRRLAAPAFGLVSQALGGDAVEAVAGGAGDEEWGGHDWFSDRQSIELIWSRSANLSMSQLLTFFSKPFRDRWLV
jgi:hypothetical protein